MIKHVLMILLFSTPLHAFALNIVVYTTYHYPVEQTQNIKVIYLDRAEQLEMQIFPNLSSDHVTAQKQAMAIINSPHWQEKQTQLINAYHDILKAYELKLIKIPAIVFNDKDVVYGTTDIAYATQLMKASYEDN